MDHEENETVGEMEARLAGGTVIDLGIEDTDIEYTAVVYRGGEVPGWPQIPNCEHITLYMPDVSGLTTTSSWWDDDHEGGREEALQLAREWVYKTHAMNIVREEQARKWREEHPDGWSTEVPVASAARE